MSAPRRSGGSRSSGSRPPSRGRDFDSDTDDWSDEDEGCCRMVSRNMLWWANLVLFCVGLACLGGSIFLWIDDDLDWNDSDVAFRATIFSCFIIILALVGMQGTCYEKVDRCDLAVYIFLLGACIIAELAVVIWYFADGDDFKSALLSIWEDWSQGKQEEWMDLRNCGIDRPGGYTYQSNAITVWSDCGQFDDGAGVCDLQATTTPPPDCVDVCFIDCYNEAEDAFKDFGTLTSVLTLLLAIFQITLLVLAILLCCGCCGADEESEEPLPPRPRPPRPRPPSRPSYGNSYGGSRYGGSRPGPYGGKSYSSSTQMARRSYGSKPPPRGSYGR